MQVDAFLGVTLAILLLFGGKGLIARVGWLRRYSIPEALVGGVLGGAGFFGDDRGLQAVEGFCEQADLVLPDPAADVVD